MAELAEEQRAAIERIDAKIEPRPTKEHIKRMKAVQSVTRQDVDARLTEKRANVNATRKRAS
jgi:hypothetical protein